MSLFFRDKAVKRMSCLHEHALDSQRGIEQGYPCEIAIRLKAHDVLARTGAFEEYIRKKIWDQEEYDILMSDNIFS